MAGISGFYCFGERRVLLLSGHPDSGFSSANQKDGFRQAVSDQSELNSEFFTFDSKSDSATIKIVADACLTNRTELFRKFGVLPSWQANFSDHKLILTAFEKWGEDCVEHLSGDFAFVIYHDQKLFCARDHLGSSKLFYYRDNDRFIFATSPGKILAFEGVEQRFNRNKLSTFLVPEPHLLSKNESWFENIFPMHAGTTLTVDSDGLKFRQYWKPEFKENLAYKDDEEILEAFRELMFEIMSDRIHGLNPVTSLLSGGLDSSSVVSVAAKVLEKQNKEITVFSGVLAENDSRFDDERNYIDEFNEFPNVKIEHVTPTGTGPFSNLQEFFANYDAPFITSRHYLYRHCLAKAEKIGSTTLFDGSMGEMGPTFYGNGGFAEMFRKLQWRRLRRELILRNKHYGESIRYNIRAKVLNPLLPDSVIRLKRMFGATAPKQAHDHPLNKNFIQTLIENNESPAAFERKTPADHRKYQFNDINFVFEKSSESPSSDFGTRDGVELRYPLMDKRLMEFSLAAPLNLKIHDGYTRYLMRAGLDKVLPPKIQWRTTKTPFSPDYIRRYYEQIGSVKDILEEMRPTDPVREVLDINKIKNWVDNSINKNKDHNGSYEELAFDRIPSAIYLIYFLRRFSEFRL